MLSGRLKPGMRIVSWHMSSSQRHTSWIPPPQQAVFCMYPRILFLGNVLVKNVTAATKTHAIIEELLEIWSQSYQGKQGINYPQKCRFNLAPHSQRFQQLTEEHVRKLLELLAVAGNTNLSAINMALVLRIGSVVLRRAQASALRYPTSTTFCIASCCTRVQLLPKGRLFQTW
jgi:hypothetical protein